MLEKKLLHELFVVTGKIDSISAVNINMLKNHVLSNWSLKNRLTDNDFKYQHDYSKVPYHQHLQWVQDYIRDHYRIEHGQTLCPVPKDSVAAIVQTENEKINTHNHLDAFDLHGSPDISGLYCVHSGENEASVTFDYNDGRRKGWSWRVPIKQGQFILFSSELNHNIGKNFNKDFLINLSFKYHLI